jgi:hypothetical protein
MGSLVKDFQRDIAQSLKSTTELLRTAKLISVKLGLNDITEWINSELNGYEDTTTIPPYRCLPSGKLQVLNPAHGWLQAGQVNRNFRVGQPVPELEALSDSKSIFVSIPREENCRVHGGMMDVSHWHQRIEFPKIKLDGLLSAVRDKLLDWSLELETRGITGENMSFDEKERKSAQGHVFNIQHFTGVLGDVSHSSVQVYDYSSLHQTLKQQNVPQQERNELENIMDGLKTAEADKKQSLLEKGRAWVVKNQEFLGASASIVRKALGLDVNP